MVLRKEFYICRFVLYLYIYFFIIQFKIICSIVAKQLYRKLRFYNRFIYCRNLIYLTYGKSWLYFLLFYYFYIHFYVYYLVVFIYFYTPDFPDCHFFKVENIWYKQIGWIVGVMALCIIFINWLIQALLASKPCKLCSALNVWVSLLH